MLDEVESAALPQHPTNLCQSEDGVRDRAQRPCRERRVETVVVEGQRLPVETGPFDRNLRRQHAVPCELPTQLGRLNRSDPLNSVGIERDVVAGPEADLQDLA